MLEVYEETHSDDHSSPAVPLQGVGCEFRPLLSDMTAGQR